MKKLLLLFIIFVLQLSADPRKNTHGISVMEYYDNQFKYLATWSSATTGSWTHDIFRENFHFEYEQLHSDSNRNTLIEAVEAQEPVQSTVIPGTKTFISVWEDGRHNNYNDCTNYNPEKDIDCVEIHARIYNTDNPVKTSDGFVVDDFRGDGKKNIAVTHAPTVSSIKASNGTDLFVIAYAEEPRGSLPRIKVRIYDKYGKKISLIKGKNVESGDIYLTKAGKDKWWPVSVSDNDKHVFIAWQVDKPGKAVNIEGCVLNVDYYRNNKYKVKCNYKKSYDSNSNSYINNAKEYHYSVAWLNEMEKFILVAKANKKSLSNVALISRDGYRDKFKKIQGYPIVREAQIAVKAEKNENGYPVYKVVYPSNKKDIAVLKIKDTASKPKITISSVWHEDNTNYIWPTTGMASLFVKNNYGESSWGQNGEEDKLMFIFDDVNNNQLIKLPIAIDKF